MFGSNCHSICFQMTMDMGVKYGWNSGDAEADPEGLVGARIGVH